MTEDTKAGIDISPEFIEENKKANLVKHRQKFAPYTRSQRRRRRAEVYRLHFEQGLPAVRIAQLMSVDRNTINNDLKLLYSQAIEEYNPRNLNMSGYFNKQLFRLEAQRDRLGLYLADMKSTEGKVAIERLIADIDFRLLRAIAKIRFDEREFWNQVIERANKVAESKNLKMRFTSLFELFEISQQSRKQLDDHIRDQIRREMKRSV